MKKTRNGRLLRTLRMKDNLNNPIVSVCVQTYQHASYIRDALDSVLMQQTDFDFEILLGEDESTDGTREICIEYDKRYPEKIRLFLNSRKNVVYINGHPTGRWNFLNNLKNARGKYIALLPGDDYWTDPFKLQKQVDFLDSHPECAICFHNVMSVFEDGKHEPLNHCPDNQKMIFSLEHLLRGNFIYTCSVMFRRGLFGEFPQWYYKCKMGDWPLHILNAQHGDIGYIDQIMAVYRIHSTGAWSPKNLIEKKIDSVCAANRIRRVLNHKHKKILNYTTTQWHKQIMNEIKSLGEKRNFDDAGYYARKSFHKFLNLNEVSKRMLTELFFIGYFPRLTYLVIRRIYRKILSMIF